jgi:hypothetical protein
MPSLRIINIINWPQGGGAAQIRLASLRGRASSRVTYRLKPDNNNDGDEEEEIKS